MAEVRLQMELAEKKSGITAPKGTRFCRGTRGPQWSLFNFVSPKVVGIGNGNFLGGVRIQYRGCS